MVENKYFCIPGFDVQQTVKYLPFRFCDRFCPVVVDITTSLKTISQDRFLHDKPLVPFNIPHRGHFLTPLLVGLPRSESKDATDGRLVPLWLMSEPTLISVSDAEFILLHSLVKFKSYFQVRKLMFLPSDRRAFNWRMYLRATTKPRIIIANHRNWNRRPKCYYLRKIYIFRCKSDFNPSKLYNKLVFQYSVLVKTYVNCLPTSRSLFSVLDKGAKFKTNHKHSPLFPGGLAQYVIPDITNSIIYQ